MPGKVQGDANLARHAMLIEDEPNIAEAIRFLLTRDGWQVTALADGGVAEQAVRRDRPDLVILDIRLPDQTVDASVAITLPLFLEDEIRTYIREAIRVTKPGGYVINLGIAPFCYGGDLAETILGDAKVTEEDTEGVVDRILRDEFGFAYFDYEAVQTYASAEHMISTYGFIFGQRAIDEIRKTGRKHVTWTYRIHYLVK